MPLPSSGPDGGAGSTVDIHRGDPGRSGVFVDRSGPRWATPIVWAAWPVGLALTFAYSEAHAIPLPAFVVLDLAYVALTVLALRTSHLPAATLIAAPGVLIFSVASFTGAPTAAAPGAMLANAAVLLAAALVLLAGYVILTARVWDGPGRTPAALGAVALIVGTAGYLANLVARFAIVLAGAAPAQAAVEERAWQAYAYLRGLDGEPSPLALLLVWLDMLQMAYVVLAYLATAALVTAARRAGLVGASAARTFTAAGVTLAGAVVVAGALGTAPGIGPAAAGVAFALTIPFMSTLLPTLFAAAMTRRHPDPGGRTRSAVESRPAAGRTQMTAAE